MLKTCFISQVFVCSLSLLLLLFLLVKRELLHTIRPGCFTGKKKHTPAQNRRERINNQQNKVWQSRRVSLLNYSWKWRINQINFSGEIQKPAPARTELKWMAHNSFIHSVCNLFLKCKFNKTTETRILGLKRQKDTDNKIY